MRGAGNNPGSVGSKFGAHRLAHQKIIGDEQGAQRHGNRNGVSLDEGRFASPGLPCLLEDLERLSEDRESADLVFLVGRDETPIRGHRLVYAMRCKNFFFPSPLGPRRNLSGSSGNGAGISVEVCSVRGWNVKPGFPVTVTVPHFSPEAFQMVHHYIYTGHVALTEETVFEVMSLAQCVGLDQLHQWTEEHVAGSLNPLNACALFGAAVALEERTKGCISKSSGATFVDTCVSYIGENAIECVRTPSFCALSKEALIRLISSDQFALEEEEVWRAVLAWAKTQASVNAATSAWTEEERQKVCSFLAPVIQYVRLLLIDSQVFAEEVEPTGSVPLELTKERYKIAALSGGTLPVPATAGSQPGGGGGAGGGCGGPGKFRQNSGNGVDPRFQPRAPPNRFFPGSQILAREDAGFQRLLNEWYGDPRESWTMVFRASQHNFSAQAFHHFCDGVAPSYVLVLGSKGEVCGGFSDVPWGAVGPKSAGGPTSSSCSSSNNNPATGGGASSSGYCASSNAFLFTLKNSHDVPPSKLPVVKRTFAISQHPDFGPTFGAGADLCIADQCHVNCESYSNLPHSYDGDNAFSGLLMGAYNFRVAEYEVFTPSQAQNVDKDKDHD
ncbi:unnamed protein product [Notodromas monacha]|uniref:BTB domain-containing protein n=1 Tax=Notodromas monacha TaxID=399045 RepID=A0A7R9BLN5_9CRUS|nr:unnamed protein product [Notodromas monacha]CAG0916691.1 unnamed protein product [Notodromas monacha]